MGMMRWTKLRISLRWRLEPNRVRVVPCRRKTNPDICEFEGARSGSIATGAQLATRGRRDMSSRLRDVVLSLALCHNVCALPPLARLSIVYLSLPR